MISIDLKQQILHLYRVDELSLREIARRTGVRTFTADHFTTDNELIIRYVKELKLPTVKDCLEDTIAQALASGWDYRRFLATLLHKEVEQRCEHRKYTRIHKAGFPQMKYLAELVREDLPVDGRNLLPEFETLEFIRDGRNIVMYGNPGTGKTHIAIGLGIKACMEGYTVFFTTVSHMLTLIRETRTDRTLQSLESRFRKYDLVICDEMGYVSFDKEGAELLFNMISTRTGDKATIITSERNSKYLQKTLKTNETCLPLKQTSVGPFFKSTLAEIYFIIYTRPVWPYSGY